jgi:hypothetical protein
MPGLAWPDRVLVSKGAGSAAQLIASRRTAKGTSDRGQIAAAAATDLTADRPTRDSAANGRDIAAGLILLAGRGRGTSRQSDNGAEGHGENLDHSLIPLMSAVTAGLRTV